MINNNNKARLNDPLTSDVKSRDTVSSRDSLGTVFTLSWYRGLHCFGLDLGLEYTVLVSYLVDTFIETVGHNAHCMCNFYQSCDHEIIFFAEQLGRDVVLETRTWTRVGLESRFLGL